MRKKLSILLATVMTAGCAFGMTACGSKNTGAKEGVLQIRYFKGGYGDEWLEYALENYAEEHEDFDYDLVDDANVTSQINTYLQSGKNLSDIYIIQTGNWSEWVSQGYLANLTDVYEAEVDTSTGKRKIKDYMDQELVDRYYMQKYAGQGEFLPWVLPEASISTSFVYNEDYLLSTPHTTTREGRYEAGTTWTAPPETVEELLDYCNDLNARKWGKGSDFEAPIAWPGNASHWLKFFLYTWFAQYQGVHEENALNASTIAGEGSYYDFWNFASAEVWKMTGIQVAIETLQSIFFDEDGDYQYSLDNVGSSSVQRAEQDFVRGKCALLVGGSFFYNEMRGNIDWDEDGEDDYTYKMMYLPTVVNAEQKEDGTTKKMVFYSTEEMMLVPAKAKNLEMAKDFLAYLFNEENNLYFTKMTGTMRPFDYDPIALAGEDYEWKPFERSVLDMYNEADVKLYAYPAGQPQEDVSRIYRYQMPDIFGQHGWATFYSAMRKYTGEEIMETGHGSSYKSVYDVTKGDYRIWFNRYYD